MSIRWRVLPIFALLAHNTQAYDICKYLKDGGVAGCNALKVTSGGSLPSQSSAHQLNPGSIPATPTSYGVEVLDSPPSDPLSSTKYSFSLVKGFKRIGTGISTGNDDTFFTHSYLHASQETIFQRAIEDIYNENTSIIRNINLGTSFRIPVGPLSKVIEPSLGVLARYNVPMKSWGWGTGLDVSSGLFSCGVSYITQPNEYELDDISMLVLMAGFGWKFFHIDYASLNYLEGMLQAKPADIWTLSLNWRRLILFGGYRRSPNFDGELLVDYLYGAQFLIGSHLSLGAMINYLPGRFTLGAQVFL